MIIVLNTIYKIRYFMKFKLFLSFITLLLAVNSYAAFPQPGKHKAARTTLSDPGEENYDIKYLKLNLHLTDTSTYIIGDVSTTAQVLAASMATYVFELDTTMHIDSAEINGAVLPVTVSSGHIRTIVLPAALAAGSLFTARIWYHGTPPSGSGFFNGVTHDTTAHGTHMLYTISDPWVALNWWPCKQSVNDKIDSMDMIVTVPRGVMDGSNGVLVSVDTSSSPGYSTFHWQTHYPIAYYLVSIAVARYAEYKSYLHFPGSTDSMLIQNFFMDTTTFNPAYKANFDSIGQIVDYFSTLFGRYPFWQEKYGVCYTNLPGGMENQTMTTIGVPNTYIIAHELCHQWFGDHVSYADWGDVWLSEGFATFSESLFFNHFWGAAAAKSHRQGLLNQALTATCGELFVTDTSSATTLFNQTTVYAKGQAVINMLRYIAPTDSLFFQVLRTYQQTYSFGNANTANLQAIAEAAYGFSLDTFFNQWVYGKGYPKYTITWDQVGSVVVVKLIQTPSCTATPTHFNTALELQLHAATADTIMQIYNSLDTQIYTFNWSPTIASVLLNPDLWTLCKLTTAIKQDTTLAPYATAGTGSIYRQNVKVFPNPSKNHWQIEQVAENTSLTLTDVRGKVLWKGKTAKTTTVIPGDRLPAGNYFLKVGDSATDSIKLVHW
jgi:aminopeptidase N